MIVPIRRLSLFIFLLLPSLASAITCTGTVFHDRSGNGIQDAGEPGLGAIAVSNGSQIVLTDSKGKFRIDAPENGFIFLIKPTGWKLPLDPLNRSRFFHPVSLGEQAHFALTPQEEPGTFNVLVTADPQVASEQEVVYYAESITIPFAKRKDLAFAVTLGDIVADEFSLLPKVAEASAETGIPWYYLNGNHDLDFSKAPAQMLSLYESEFGPGSYAWEYAGILFVALDDIRPKDGGGHTGGLTAGQFKFLENLFKIFPNSRNTVLMLHIPLFQNGAFGAETFRRADRDHLFQVLARRKSALILSGHTHTQCHVFHGKNDGWKGTSPLHEYNVAAACGSFWSGPPDKSGIPDATMWDGTPPGAAVIKFQEDNRYLIDYVPSRRDPLYQIGLHLPNSVRAGTGWISFYANVFNGHEGWTVEYKIGDRPWKAMNRIEAWDPSYAQIFLDQNRKEPAAEGKRFPDPVECRHLWRSYLPKDLAPGEQKLEIRATGPEGQSFTAGKTFQVIP